MSQTRSLPSPFDMGRLPEQLFLDSLPFIEKAVSHGARRYRLSSEEKEDFASDLKLKLIWNNYEVLRNFRGHCKLESYLTVVIERCLKDYVNHLWGKWRPCAEAKRLGKTAELLDRLLDRDGYSLDEAYGILKTHYRIPESRPDVEKLAEQLPKRMHRKIEGEEELRDVPADVQTDQLLQDHERRLLRQRVQKALDHALPSLTPEDRLLVRRRSEGASFQEIAFMLKVDVKQLYRRHEKALKTLRMLLGAAGILPQHISEILGKDSP